MPKAKIGLLSQPQIVFGGYGKERSFEKPRTSYHILCVFGGKRGGVVAAGVRDLDDLGGFKGGQVDPGDAGGVVAIDEAPTAVGFPIGLGEFGVVGVIPGHEPKGGVQQRLGFLVEAIPFFRVQ